MDIDEVCDGSRRPVNKKRHNFRMTDTHHMKADCPHCGKVGVRVKMYAGVLSFTRHPTKKVAAQKKNPKTPQKK
jgi:hypothetical protein